MSTSPSNERGRHHTARRAKRKRVWLVLGALALTALAFFGYRQPDLLFDYINLRYCG